MWAIEPSLLIEIVPEHPKYGYYCLDFGLAVVQSLGQGFWNPCEELSESFPKELFFCGIYIKFKIFWKCQFTPYFLLKNPL